MNKSPMLFVLPTNTNSILMDVEHSPVSASINDNIFLASSTSPRMGPPRNSSGVFNIFHASSTEDVSAAPLLQQSSNYTTTSISITVHQPTHFSCSNANDNSTTHDAPPKKNKRAIKSEMIKSFGKFFSCSASDSCGPSELGDRNPFSMMLAEASRQKDKLQKECIEKQPVIDIETYLRSWLLEQDGFEAEFESLTTYENSLRRQTGFHKTAFLPKNCSKNRFKNVFPNEPTRFKLHITSNDYINANVIDFPKYKPNSIPSVYIATQAPLPSTFSDFWAMVWESKSEVVVSLVDEIHPLEENNVDEASMDLLTKNKAHQYWPSVGTSTTYHLQGYNLSVTGTNQTWKNQRGTIVIQKFELTLQQLQQKLFQRHSIVIHEEKRTVSIVQFVNWADMGVPQSVEEIVELFQVLDQFNCVNKNIPIIVHCLAGQGRTGTFCTLHYIYLSMKEFLKKQSDPYAHHYHPQPFGFDIYNIVKYLKSQRVGMVLRKDQYIFCYTASVAMAKLFGILPSKQ